MTTGYLDPGYAESLAEFGTPCQLPASGAWILKRTIPGFAAHDAMGCYPLLSCADWSGLHSDLDSLSDQFVAVTAVADPFGEHDEAYLRECFQDVVIPFKEHFVTDLTQPFEARTSDHHRRYSRKALRRVTVEQCHNPAEFVEDWVAMYAAFIEKRQMKGFSAFSRTSLERQLTVPGLVMFRAVDKTVVGMHMWYASGDVGYAHLAAYSDTGYKLGASYALFYTAIQHFASNGFRWLELGSVPGSRSSDGNGLTEFKSGWSTGTRMAYFCGRILNRARYCEIVRAKNVSATGYFPAYRDGE